MGGRVPAIVTTSHFSTRIATERARKAAARGRHADAMPPYHGVGLRAEEKGMIEHFAAVAEAADSDMVQDAP